MQRSSPLFALAVATTIAASGCYSVKYHVEDSSTPIEETAGSGRFRYHFKEEGRNYFIGLGLLPIWGDRTETMLARHMVRGSRISNLKITNQFGAMDVLLSAGSYFLLAVTLAPVFYLGTPYVALPLALGSRTVTYEGDVVDDVEAAE